MEDMKQVLLVIAFVMIACVVLFLVLTPLEDYTCHKKWDRSGLGVEYEIGSGCVLTLKDGTKILADHYRVMP